MHYNINCTPIRKLWSSLAAALLVAVTWVVTFRLNSLLFTESSHSSYINYIFLPAGVRLLSILLFEEIAVLGLLIVTCIGISLISAINPYISLKCSLYLLKVDDILSNFGTNKLMLMCMIYASLNSISHNLYFLHLNLISDLRHNLIVMFVGDFVGCLLVLYTFSFAIKLFRFVRKLQ